MRNLLLATLVLAGLLAPSTSAQDCSNLTANFDGTLATGGTVTVDLTASSPVAPTVLFAGPTLGQTCVDVSMGSFCLGLDLPFAPVFAGTSDVLGSLSLSVDLPPIPAAVVLDPFTVHIQSVSYGLVFNPWPSVGFCVSNVASLDFQ